MIWPFKVILGHSFCNQSQADKGSVSPQKKYWPYIWSFRRSSHSNRQKLPSSTTPPRQEEPLRVSAYTLYFQKLESSDYIFVVDSIWVYLHSNLCSGLQKTHLFCNRVRIGRSRSFRVIQNRWFWYQSKARIRLPISSSLWLWSYLAPFSRYGDLLANNCLFLLHFPYPSLIRRPRSLCSLWNFGVKLTAKKLESWGYPPVKTAWS